MATIISTKTTGVGGLSVTGDASGILQLASADGTTALTIDGSQNVGIGTSSVNSGNRLDVVKSVTTGDLTTQRHIRVGVDTNNNYSGFIGYGSPIAGQTGGLILQSYDNNIASNTYLNPNGGNVGIGTSSPSQKLEVSGASASTGNVNARVTNTQSAVSVDLAVTGSAYSYLNIPASGAYLYSTSSLSLANSSANPITFITNSTERMRIDSSGNVGIGIVPNTSLTPKLEIASTFSAATNGSPYNGLLVGSTDAQAGDKGGVISLGGLYDASNGVTRFAAIAGLKENSTSGQYGGYMAFYTRANGSSPTERMRIDSSGNLLVGTTGVTSSTVVSKSKGIDTYQGYNTNNAFTFAVSGVGQIYATSTTIATISDIRLKENVRHLDSVLLQVMDLKPRLFDWKEGKGKNIKNDRGFIAQEFEKVFPDLIDEWRDPAPKGEESYKSVRADLIPVLVKAIQELKAIIDTQQEQINSLLGK